MRRADRRIIENIILIRPILYALADAIEKEQERAIADVTSPAAKVVDSLFALDNRRIDICNLKVLYEFIRRELGMNFGAFERLVQSGTDSALFDRALGAMESAGYDIARAEREFAYLFKLIKRPKKGKVIHKSELRIKPQCASANA